MNYSFYFLNLTWCIFPDPTTLRPWLCPSPPLPGCSLNFPKLAWSHLPAAVPWTSLAMAPPLTDPHRQVRPFLRHFHSSSPSSHCLPFSLLQVLNVRFMANTVFLQTSPSPMKVQEQHSDQERCPARTRATDTGIDEGGLAAPPHSTCWTPARTSHTGPLIYWAFKI